MRTLVVLAIALGVLVAPGHFSNPDAHLRLSQAEAWLNGALALPSAIGDPAHGNVAINEDGQRFAVYAPGQSLIFVPAAVLGQLLSRGPTHSHYLAAWFASFYGPIVHFVTAVLVVALGTALGWNRQRALLVGFTYALATQALPHSTDGYEQTYEAFALVAGMYCLVKGQHDRVGWSRLAGLCIACGLLFRPTAILALPALLLFARTRRSLAYLLAGAALGGAVLLSYNYLRFGNPFDSGYASAWKTYVPQPADHYMSLARIPANAALLLVSPGKGLFPYSPILAVCVFGFPGLWRRNKLLVLSAASVMTVYVVFYAANWAWHGSLWCWGPRYIVPVIPLLTLGLGDIRLSRASCMAIVLALVVSTGLQLTACTVNYRRYLLRVYESEPRAFDDGRLVSSVSWSPIVGISGDLLVVLESLVSGHAYHAYLNPGPWRSEDRPVNSMTMLESSIDLNVPNYWWARAIFLPFRAATKVLLALLFFTTGGVVVRCLLLEVRQHDT